MTQKTVEELQAEIIEMQSKMEQIETENAANKKNLEDTQKSLDKAREINAVLWQKQNGGTLPTPNPDNTEDTEVLTPEKAMSDLIADAMNPNLKRMRSIYGDTIPEKVIQE